MHRVFVYGTLKRGQPNYGVMTDQTIGKATFQGQGETKFRFPLVIAGPFNIPYCVNKEGVGEHVRGELYEVDDKMLAYLDKMEDIPVHYQRLIQTIYLDADNRSESHDTEAFIYQLCDYKDFILELPFFKDYDSYGPHGLQYVSRKYRDKTKSWFEVLKGH